MAFGRRELGLPVEGGIARREHGTVLSVGRNPLHMDFFSQWKCSKDPRKIQALQCVRVAAVKLVVDLNVAVSMCVSVLAVGSCCVCRFVHVLGKVIVKRYSA